MADTQALDFDHLHNLQFETCVKHPSGFRIAHGFAISALTTYRAVCFWQTTTTIPAQLAPMQETSPAQQAKRAESLGAAKDSTATFLLTYLHAYPTSVLKVIENTINGLERTATIDAVSGMANQSEVVSSIHIKELRQAVRHLPGD